MVMKKSLMMLCLDVDMKLNLSLVFGSGYFVPERIREDSSARLRSSVFAGELSIVKLFLTRMLYFSPDISKGAWKKIT